MAMSNYERDNKEVHLFGDKSIREEAYRKKILQLEKEISNLETLAKSQEDTYDDTPVPKPENLSNLYYESLMSFDMRIKKEQDFLEKRATEITERLDIQAQKALLGIEKLYRRQARFSFVMIFCFAAFTAIIFFSSKSDFLPGRSGINYTDSMESRVSYIRDGLSGTTKYRHHYTVGRILTADNRYIVDIDLSNPPSDIWQLRDMAQEVVRAFYRFSGRSQGEISFSFDGKVYAKATLSGPASKPYIRYFQ
jgi:hypothetical protein